MSGKRKGFSWLSLPVVYPACFLLYCSLKPKQDISLRQQKQVVLSNVLNCGFVFAHAKNNKFSNDAAQIIKTNAMIFFFEMEQSMDKFSPLSVKDVKMPEFHYH